MGRLTTHILDTAKGCPAEGVSIELFAERDGQWAPVRAAITNADGRCDAPLLDGDALLAGRYRLMFHIGDYFRRGGALLPEPAFVDVVPLDFGIADPSAHYHVPLLVSPWSYSTYRGS